MSAPRANLGHHASRGIAVTLGGAWGKTLVQLASTVVLARLLPDEAFGLLAMITAIVGVADLVRDFGMTGAIVQTPWLGRAIWKSIYWFSTALGAALALLIALLAPAIAALYGEPRLVQLTWAIAPTLLLNGIAMPLQARATRELRFAALASIDVLAMAIGVASSITTALLGWGVWALVAFAVAPSISRLVFLWWLIRPRFGTPRIRREVFPLVMTGGNIFGSALVGYAEKNLDTVIVGQQLGPDVLGQYSRAYALFLLPIQQLAAPVGRVALPILSQLQNDGERYRRYVSTALLVNGYTIFTTYAIAAALAHPLIELLLGPDWTQAATIFSLLAIPGIVQAFGNVRTWISISLGLSRRQFRFDLVSRPIVVVGYFVGIWWNGVEGLVIVYGILSVLLMIPAMGTTIAGTFVRPGDILKPVLRPGIAALLAFGASTLAITLLAGQIAIVQLVVGGLAGLVPVGLLMLLPPYRRDLRSLAGLVRQAKKPAGA